MNKQDDTWKAVVIQQGYVPRGCTLNGGVVWALINQSEDPCGGCNEQRSVCSGRPPVSIGDWEKVARTHIDTANKVLFPDRFGD